MPTCSYIWSEEERETCQNILKLIYFNNLPFFILSPLSIQINMRTIG